MAHLGTRSRQTNQLGSDPSGNTFQQVSEPDPVQAEAFRLLGL